MVKIKIWSVILILGMLPMLLACSSEDDDYSLVGTWTGYRCDDITTLEIKEYHPLTLVFNSDGSGNYYEKEGDYIHQCTFVYEMESKTRAKAYISWRGSSQYYEIVDNKMYVYGHGYGNDLDFLLTKK